jgi:serine/threonine protein kinase
MGSVYRAWDGNLETDVVIKIPHPYMLRDPEFATRFAREVRALVRLSHPHVVKITDVGDQNGLPFAVMQYLSGGSLQDRRPTDHNGQPAPMDPAGLGRWLWDVALALDFIHREGYVHRDIKPGNIVFDAHGNAFLSDFGIANLRTCGLCVCMATLQGVESGHRAIAGKA